MAEQHSETLEAITDLKPLPRTVLTPGQYNGSNNI